MSLIPQPSLGGKKLPVSIDLAAMSWGQHMAKKLIRFKELGGSPERDGITVHEIGQPITDPEYWEGLGTLPPQTGARKRRGADICRCSGSSQPRT